MNQINCFYCTAGNSQAKTLIGSGLVGILQYGSIPWKRSFSVFILSSRKLKLSETQKAEIISSSQQYNYRTRNLVIHVKGYHSKFADGRQR